MKRRHLYRGLIILLVSVLLLASGCSSGAKGANNEAKRDELAQAFMMDLRDSVLIYRKQPQKLADLGLVVTNDAGAQNTALLEDFYKLYQEAREAQVTIAFYSSAPLVIARVQIDEDGGGYYFRYVLDEDEPIGVTAKYVDKIEFSQGSDSKIQLKLLSSGKNIANFTFIPQ